MSEDQVKPAAEGEPLVASVPDAGAMAKLSKARSYAAAKDGSMPTIKIAGAMKVPLKRWRAILNGDENP
jgi:hypothetical protein